jgi:hypothetical protein
MIVCFARVIAKIKVSPSKQRLSKAHAGAIVSAVRDNGSGDALRESSGHYSISEGLKTSTYNVSAFAVGCLTSEISNV